MRWSEINISCHVYKRLICFLPTVCLKRKHIPSAMSTNVCNVKHKLKQLAACPWGFTTHIAFMFLSDNSPLLLKGTNGCPAGQSSGCLPLPGCKENLWQLNMRGVKWPKWACLIQWVHMPSEVERFTTVLSVCRHKLTSNSALQIKSTCVGLEIGESREN